MKYLHRLTYLLLIASIVIGCDSITDIEQPGNLPADQAIQSVEDLSFNVPGLYANLDEFDSVYFNSVFTDEIAIGFGNGGQGLGGEYNFVINSAQTISSTVWNSSYSGINEFNRSIIAANENIPQPTDSTTQANYDDLLGQIYAMRAYQYFKLLSYYSPDLTDDSSLGVIVTTDVPSINDQRPRNTTGETFQQILSDLDQAETLIDDTSTDITRFTQLSLTALRARIAAYRKNYSLAETLSQNVIDQTSLAAPQDYLDMYRDDTAGEVIFKLARTTDDPFDAQPGISPAGSGWIGGVYAQVSITQGVHYELERALSSLYTGNDVRRTVTVGVFNGGDIVLQRKYTGNVPGENQPLMNDQKVIRASEMVLINAEAKAAQNDFTGAATMLQMLRTARNIDGSTAAMPAYTSRQEALADVLLERRKELALEGHRWHDLGRIGADANAVIDRNPDVTPASASCATYGACEGPVPGQSNFYWLPIPQQELTANNQIQQNPGYSGGS